MWQVYADNLLAELTFAPGIHVCVYTLLDWRPCTYRWYPVIHDCVYMLMDRRLRTYRCYPVIHVCVYMLLDRRLHTYRSNICKTCKLLYLEKIKQVLVLIITYNNNQSTFCCWFVLFCFYIKASNHADVMLGQKENKVVWGKLNV